MSFHFKKLGLALALTGSLAGCSAVVKTPYNSPSVQVLNSSNMMQKNKNVNLSDQWWTLFNDAQLNQLVEQVLAKNSDLIVAGITLKQARLQAGLAETNKAFVPVQVCQQVITMIYAQEMALIVVYRPVWVSVMS
jgi:hypothetical protein